LKLLFICESEGEEQEGREVSWLLSIHFRLLNWKWLQDIIDCFSIFVSTSPPFLSPFFSSFSVDSIERRHFNGIVFEEESVFWFEYID
jgi:hypothetical protein